MDYGKLAYLKVEELEQRLAVKNTEKTDSSVRRAFFPKYNLEIGDYSFTTLNASGLVTMILKLKIARECTIKGTLELKIANYCTSIIDVSGEYGEQEYVMLASVNVSGSADIVLSPSLALYGILKCIDLVCIGGGATLSGGLNNWNADFCGAVCAAAISKNESIFVIRISNQIDCTIDVGRGHILDIVGVDNGFSLVFCDDFNNCWGVRFNIELQEQSRRFLGVGAQAITVASVNNRLVIAYLTQGKVISKMCDVDFGGLSYGAELDVGVKAEDIRFVKQANIPMLAVYSEGISYLKFAAEETTAATTFRVTSKFSYQKL